MGVGYSASPLHRISYLEPVQGAKEQPPPADMVPILKAIGGVWDGRPTVFRSPTIPDIVRWRNALNDKYRVQLGEELTWDEGSDFEKSEDVATSADMLLRYVAAILDQQGRTALRALAGATQPPYPVLNAVFAEAARRGFGGRFPQLLLGAKYWLPYKRHLIMEEPNWRGDVERYGSLFQLSAEIKKVRDAISYADQSATVWTADKDTPMHDVLAAAWQASDIVSRLCATAIAQHLPLWTTG